MTEYDPISSYDDVIDSRDIIARIEHLEDGRANDELTEEGGNELVALIKLAKVGAEYADDWEHGVTLVRESYFVDYAEELAVETSESGKLLSHWPYGFIDWDAAADDLRQDYTALRFDDWERITDSPTIFYVR